LLLLLLLLYEALVRPLSDFLNQQEACPDEYVDRLQVLLAGCDAASAYSRGKDQEVSIDQLVCATPLSTHAFGLTSSLVMAMHICPLLYVHARTRSAAVGR
jgi:hypothetical protein